MNPDQFNANINFDADKSPPGCASDHFVAYPDHFCELQNIFVNINIPTPQSDQLFAHYLVYPDYLKDLIFQFKVEKFFSMELIMWP